MRRHSVRMAPWWYSLTMGDKITLKTGYRAEVLGVSEGGVIQVLREDSVVMDVGPEDIRR